MRILVLAAHPDDEVLGCGGTVARLSQEGHEVYFAILGEGLTSRSDQRERVSRGDLGALHSNSRAAIKLLGGKDLFTYGLPDNRFDTVPLLEVVKIIEQLIAHLKPETIYTQHGGDLNIDHLVTYRATLTATRPVAGCGVKELYAYEVPSSTEWAFGQFSPAFHANVFVDISSTLKVKIEAMQLYKSEAREFPHPRSPKALEAIARRWGSVAGCGAAEAFALVRAIR